MLYLDVCGEDDDRGFGNFLANHPSRVEPFRRVAWRHLDVDDCELGPMLSDKRNQFGSVAALADDIEPFALEKARQTFAKQDIVVRERDSRSARGHVFHYRLASTHTHRSSRGEEWSVVER